MLLTVHRVSLAFKNEPDFSRQLVTLEEIEKETRINFYHDESVEFGGWTVISDAPFNVELERFTKILHKHNLKAVITTSTSYEL